MSFTNLAKAIEVKFSEIERLYLLLNPLQKKRKIVQLPDEEKNESELSEEQISFQKKAVDYVALFAQIQAIVVKKQGEIIARGYILPYVI